MKKLFTLVLAVMLVASMTTVSFAAESTTTLTTTVPAANYTLNIPANQEIPFGTTQADIGNITVTDPSGFAVGKNLEVTVSYDAFTTQGVSTTIPYTLSLFADESRASDGYIEYIGVQEIQSGGKLLFLGKITGDVEESIKIEAVSKLDNDPKVLDVETIRFNALSEDWGKALAGEYTSTITFIAEVVAE